MKMGALELAQLHTRLRPGGGCRGEGDLDVWSPVSRFHFHSRFHFTEREGTSVAFHTLTRPGEQAQELRLTGGAAPAGPPP